MPALFWATSRVGSEAIGSLGEWRNIVANIMREEGVQNVSLNSQDINGFTPGTFVAVTFIQLDNVPTFVVVIMVAGDTAEASRDLSVRLQNRVQHVTVL
jgi:hypothetical protein